VRNHVGSNIGRHCSTKTSVMSLRDECISLIFFRAREEDSGKMGDNV
jgi:hypothetical protein